MKMIRPTVITDSNLTSSTAPETDHPVWSGATTYAKGDQVMRTGIHRCYESLIDGNLNKTPESNLVEPTPAWLDIGPTNKWAMFDAVVGTQTVLASPLTVVLTPGRINALALLDIQGSSLTVTMTSSSGGGTVYSRTLSLLSGGAGVSGWFSYFYAPIFRLTDVVLTDLPLYADCVLTITITDPSVSVAIGTCVVGTSVDLGMAQYGAKLGIIDYSKKDTDVFGNTSVVVRRYSKRMSIDLFLNTPQVDALAALLAQYRSTPVVWIGAGQKFQSLIIYGFYKDFEIEIAYPTYSYCTLSIEGL